MTTDAPLSEKKGPKGHRFWVITLTVILGLLFYWLLGFFMNDISDQPGPDLSIIQKKYQDPVLVKAQESLGKQRDKLTSTIDEQHQQQSLLQTSINSYRDTMNQLLDLQKASIQKGVSFSPESEKNLHEVTALYLGYQQKFQNLSNSITQNNLQVQNLQNKMKGMEEQLAQQNKHALKDYEQAWQKHNWLMAGLQLLVLIPLLLLSAFLFKKYRKSVYQSVFMAAGIAVFLKIAQVMHAYFPSYIFKYLLILALIYITISLLISKLRMVAAPKPEWLQKQYREAYQKSQCPNCQFAIKPGIAKFLPGERPPESASLSNYLEQVEAYTCPSCGESLFEPCPRCSHVRHSLLHYCDFCGLKKDEPLKEN